MIGVVVRHVEALWGGGVHVGLGFGHDPAVLLERHAGQPVVYVDGRPLERCKLSRTNKKTKRLRKKQQKTTCELTLSAPLEFRIYFPSVLEP